MSLMSQTYLHKLFCIFLPLGGRPSFSLFLARAFKATEAYEEKGGFLCNNNMHSITFIPPSAARQPFYISREKTLPTGKCFKTVPKQFFAHKKIHRYAGNYSATSTRRRISCRSPLVGRTERETPGGERRTRRRPLLLLLLCCRHTQRKDVLRRQRRALLLLLLFPSQSCAEGGKGKYYTVQYMQEKEDM